VDVDSDPAPQPRPTQPAPTQIKDVVLNGVAFESSRRSLVRKDLPKPPSSGPSKPRVSPPQTTSQPFTRKSGHLIPATRIYKPKAPRGRRGRNMTLNNSTRTSYQARRAENKRLKYSDKPCPRFTTTGSCNRGLTCPYQHDSTKIAICWNFLQGSCSFTADSCALSHNPTPERTPLCLHFLNKGRCTRNNCPFPHINVGARHGVCRDFAVLGYCDKGLDCDKQHVRECPDFAEKGTCSTKGCKLPHVIRANRNRNATGASMKSVAKAPPPSGSTDQSHVNGGNISASTDISTFEEQQRQLTAEDAQLGDEYISLTFNESESSDEVSEEEDDNDDDSDSEEGSDPSEESEHQQDAHLYSTQ